MTMHVITAHILIDVDDQQFPNHQDAVVTDGLNELFRSAASFVVDWGYDAPAVRRDDLDPTSYEEGDFLTA